jgi:hypothetical protein
MYKLGFTSMSSVQERFAYKGNGDEALIDQIYLFVYDREAFYYEEKLHNHFRDKKAFGEFSNRPDAPLYKNGQSELYCTDIVGLDASYKDEQGQRTADAVRSHFFVASSRPTDKTDWLVRVAVLVLMVPVKTIGFLIKGAGLLYDKFVKKERLAPPTRPRGPSAEQLRREKEMARLLDWVKANQLDPSKPLPLPLPEPVLVTSEPAAQDHARQDHLWDKVQTTRRGAGSDFLRLTLDLKACLPTLRDDPFMAAAAAEAFVLSSSGAYLGGHISDDDYAASLSTYQSTTPAVRGDIEVACAASEQAIQLLGYYGFDLSDEEQLALLRAPMDRWEEGPNKWPEGITDDAGIVAEIRRRALAAGDAL